MRQGEHGLGDSTTDTWAGDVTCGRRGGGGGGGRGAKLIVIVLLDVIDQW